MSTYSVSESKPQKAFSLRLKTKTRLFSIGFGMFATVAVASILSGIGFRISVSVSDIDIGIGYRISVG